MRIPTRSRLPGPSRHRRLLQRSVAAVLGAALIVVPASGGSAAGGDPAAKRREVQARRAKLAAQLNVMKASDAQLQRALDALEANVAAQQARVADARQAATTATRQAEEARRAEQAKAAELAALQDQLRKLAVDAYVSPTSDDLVATLNSKSFADATRKREFLNYRVNRGGDLVDRLSAAREDLMVKRQAADAARQQAAARKARVESVLGGYQQSLRRQQTFADQLEQRIDASLSEAASLARVDAQLAGEIARRNALLAARARPSRSGGGGRVVRSGGRVATTVVRGIEVAVQIADQLERMLATAESDGFVFGGGGYRDSSEQVALRRAHCGSSDYDIYEKPASECSPPTAKPGSSMHEQGLAIDFTWQGRIIGSRGSPAFQWLSRNASRFGFYNLPSEPWHWSTNGN